MHIIIGSLYLQIVFLGLYILRIQGRVLSFKQGVQDGRRQNVGKHHDDNHCRKKYHLCRIAIKTGSNFKIGNAKFRMG